MNRLENWNRLNQKGFYDKIESGNKNELETWEVLNFLKPKGEVGKLMMLENWKIRCTFNL